ncbi:ATP-binding protein [Actinocorallia aurea]
MSDVYDEDSGYCAACGRPDAHGHESWCQFAAPVTNGGKDEGKAQDGEGRGPSQASQLVKLARDRFDMFMSSDGRPYAVLKQGANLALPLRGKAGLRAKLAKLYADANGGSAAPSAAALSDAVTVLEGFAQDAEERVPQLRTALCGDRIVVDLGTPDGRCVVVGPGGWSRESRSPVLFRRSGAMRSLPEPVRDGDGLAKLRRLLNMSDESFRLLVGWLLAAFIPDLPHPILTFRGEQGTGKSKSAQMVIGIIDPSGAPKRTAPRDLKGWAVQAFNSWGLCIDNISIVPDWLSDALCRAVTGDGIVDRALYSDDDVVVLEFRRVLALTTIDAGALAGDLAERLLTIELALIPDSERREEAELDRAYADAHASILASLFDLLADVLKALPDVHLTERPRMADFARVLAAVDHVTGWKTLASYRDGARSSVADVLDGQPFILGVAELVDRKGEAGFLGTAQDLLDEVKAPSTLPKSWPKDATRAGGQLKRHAPALRTVGIDVVELTRTKKGKPWKLTATADRLKEARESGNQITPGTEQHQLHQTPTQPALTSENKGDAEGVALASPLPGSGDAGDAVPAGGDAGALAATPARNGPEHRKQPSGVAGDAGDAEKHPRSHATTCAGCGSRLPARLGAVVDLGDGRYAHPDDECERKAREHQ